MFTAKTLRDLALLLLLTAAVIGIHGYHLGVEDQATYLPGIKKELNPQLYPHDAAFFMAQTRWTLLVPLVAASVRVLHLPLDVAVFLWHVAGVFLFLAGCLRLSRKCFTNASAQWAGVTMVISVIAIPIAGTLMLMLDAYMHPRALSAAAILFATSAVLERKLSALAWTALAALIHPQIALFGSAHLVILAWNSPRQSATPVLAPPSFWPPANDAWRELLATRSDWLVFRWRWYEWLGAIGPLVLLAWFSRQAAKCGAAARKLLCERLAISCALMVAAAVVVNVVPQLQRLIPLQPMRTLHLVYTVLLLIGGGLVADWVLRERVWRWLLFFLPICTGMYCAERFTFPDSPHIEWPGRATGNEWIAAFEWIKENTPQNALFALDPRYLERPGEDQHGFRAFAERSMLADFTKDRGVVGLFPEIAYSWREQVRDRENWSNFDAADFQRLKRKFGTTWAVIERPGAAALSCPYSNGRVMVCRIP
jgi:uncharacterized protein DUF6798